MKQVNTVTGTVAPEKLGTTLMHEHLLIGWAGWELDCTVPKFDRKSALKNCVETLKPLKDLGLQSIVDPCPMDIGRDVTFMGEVGEKSGVNIVCATGLYKEDLGNTAYFKQRSVEEITEVYVGEITKGIGDTGIKAGIIKCATGKGAISTYEENTLRAAARAQKRTGVPITTHTEEGTMGREQVAIFLSEGVDPNKIVIGHSCGIADLRYHTDMLDKGVLLGFDRFGLDFAQPDRLRLASLIGLCGIGFEKQIVLSHDSVACWLGRGLEITPQLARLVENWKPSHMFQNVVPALRKAGVTQEKIDAMLIDNPRRYFQN